MKKNSSKVGKSERRRLKMLYKELRRIQNDPEFEETKEVHTKSKWKTNEKHT